MTTNVEPKHFKETGLDSFGARLTESVILEKMVAGLLVGSEPTMDGFVFKDNAHPAGIVLNWICTGKNKSPENLGDCLGMTDGKTVIIPTENMFDFYDSDRGTRDAARWALEAAEGKTGADSKLKVVSVADMEEYLGKTLKKTYPDGEWREKLGYDEANISHFGIVQAKEALDKKDAGMKINHGSFIGEAGKAISDLITARSPNPTPKEFSGSVPFLGEGYNGGSRAVRTAIQLAGCLNFTSMRLNPAPREEQFSKVTDYSKWVAGDPRATKEDVNILVEVASQIALLKSAVSLEDHHELYRIARSNAGPDKPKRMKP